MQENNLKIYSLQNQDLTPPKSIFEGGQNPSFEYKKISIIILLLQLYYIPNYIKKLLPDAPCIKNFNGMIIRLVPREKSRKVACVLNGTEMLSTKANYKQKHAFSNIIQKAFYHNLPEEKTEYLICDRSNYSVKIFTATSTTV